MKKSAILTCASKKSYPNWRVAEDKAIKFEKAHKAGFDIYPCNVCGNYHLTSKGNKK